MDFRDNDWRGAAECKKADPNLFFPSGERSAADRDQIQQAKEFCVRCLVKERCLDYALDTGQDSGVWGGMSERERGIIRQRISAARRRRL